MKHMKKMLALIVGMVLLCQTVCYATSVSVDLAAKELQGYGILVGDETGNLNLEQTVTRAEMVVIACRLLALSNTAKDMTVTDDVFSDVLPEHWAAGYIKLARDHGIVDGYPNGSFCPEREVSYQEALKIVVGVLGYLPQTEALGGYPGGILGVASQIGLTEDVTFVATAFATRGDIAVFSKNALDIPLLLQTGFGSFLEFQVNEEITLRTQNFQIKP